MFKRRLLSSAIVLAGSVWGGAALATTDSVPFSSAAEITKVSEWMGKDVQDNEGNEVGEITDFALNAKDGSVAYAVVALSGMFNNQAIAVPLSALSSSAASDDELILQFSQSDWKAADTFTGSDWPLEASLTADSGLVATSMNTAEPTKAEPTMAEPTKTASGTEWQQSEDQHDQQSGTVPSFDRPVTFESRDTDADGYLSMEEFQAATGADGTYATDQDQDGRISRSEFSAFEAREQDSGMQKEPASATGYGETDADHGYDSEEADHSETDDQIK